MFHRDDLSTSLSKARGSENRFAYPVAMSHLVVGRKIGNDDRIFGTPEGSGRTVICKKTFISVCDAPAETVNRSQSDSSLSISQGGSSNASDPALAVNTAMAETALAKYAKHAAKELPLKQPTRLQGKSSSSPSEPSTVAPQVPSPVEGVLQSFADQTESEAAHLAGNCKPFPCQSDPSGCRGGTVCKFCHVCTSSTNATEVKKRRARPCKSARDRWKRGLVDFNGTHEDNPTRSAEEMMSMPSQNQDARRLSSSKIHVPTASRTKVSL
eukprot:TRINITY_DN9109_c0_g1_i3.p1 TRINITY_DN9109_c0_g1~~TRINITY_DN9109_c0_g1_i3.p1  ORF type:complete len:269 (+),score=39.91 TRINITY_DN9109_c0_g1_i3:291-1097(+)